MAEKDFESMQDMDKRLSFSGASGQVKAVIAAIKKINGSPGALDKENASAAIYHLAVALVGSDYAITLLDNALWIAGADFDEQEV